MQPLTSPDDFEALRELPLALVYKHSTRCPIAAMAYNEVAEVHGEYPEIPVHVVDVIADRSLARHIAARTGVVHESPQLILLVHGRPAWSVAHFEVRADTIDARLTALV